VPAPFWLVLLAALMAQPVGRDPSVDWLDGPVWTPDTTVTWNLELRADELVATPRPGQPVFPGHLELRYLEELEIIVLSEDEVRLTVSAETVHSRSVLSLDDAARLLGREPPGMPSETGLVVHASGCPLCDRDLVGRRGADGWRVTLLDEERPTESEQTVLDRLALVLGPDGYPEQPLAEGANGVLGAEAFERWFGHLLGDLEASGSWQVRGVEHRDAGRGAVVDLQALAAGTWVAPILPPFEVELLLNGQTFRPLDHRLDAELTLHGLMVIVPEPGSPDNVVASDSRGEVTITLRTEVR